MRGRIGRRGGSFGEGISEKLQRGCCISCWKVDD